MTGARQDTRDHIVAFYSRHPISADHILAKLEQERGTLEGLAPEDLWPHDQDHYGGLEVNDAIAEAAGLEPGLHVVDFCAGLGGPARYLAVRYGVTVTGLELNPDRVRGARRLTEAVGLEDRVRFVEADVTMPPLEMGSADVVVSQEAFLHVPDKAAAVAAAYALLRPGGRFCFSDWVAGGDLTAEEADLLWRGLGAQTLQSPDGYAALLERSGFERLRADDLTAAWAVILEERRAMYERLRAETLAAGKPSGDQDFYDAYVLLVDCVRDGRLGGIRLTARK